MGRKLMVYMATALAMSATTGYVPDVQRGPSDTRNKGCNPKRCKSCALFHNHHYDIRRFDSGLP